MKRKKARGSRPQAVTDNILWYKKIGAIEEIAPSLY